MNTEATKTTEAAAVTEQGADVAPKQAPPTKKASNKKRAPKGQKAANKAARKQAAKPASKKASKAATPKPEGQPREGSKKLIVLDLLHSKDGATMAEIAKATGWQNHTIRGFVSGTLMKKMDLPVESFKNDAGDRTYRLAK